MALCDIVADAKMPLEQRINATEVLLKRLDIEMSNEDRALLIQRLTGIRPYDHPALMDGINDVIYKTAGEGEYGMGEYYTMRTLRE